MSDFERATRLLWTAIPRKRKPRAKSQKTWKTLEPGRELRLLTQWFDGANQWEIGQTFTVWEVDSLGVSLRRMVGDPDWSRRWTREWKGTFEKVSKVRRKKHANSK